MTQARASFTVPALSEPTTIAVQLAVSGHNSGPRSASITLLPADMVLAFAVGGNAPPGKAATVTAPPEPPTPTPTPEHSPIPVSPTGGVARCEGDCDADGAITIDELVAAVNEALGGAPAEVCGSFDRDDDGAVGIHELIALVRDALSGCSDLDLSGVDGVYDVTGTRTDRFGSVAHSGIAIVQRHSGRLLLAIEFSIGSFLNLSSQPTAGATLILDGGGATNGDLAFQASGNGALTRPAGSIRLDVTVDTTFSILDDARLNLALERPTTGTPTGYGGTHVVTLQHSPRSGTELPFESQVALTIDVPASGNATCAATRDARDGDTVLAELPAAACAVSPLGRVSYYTPYDTGEQFPPPLKLLGEIAADSGTQGIGFFSIGLHPVQRDAGIWRSEKELD